MTYIPSNHVRPRLIDWDRTSLCLKAEPLNVKLKRLEADLMNAEWEEDASRIVALDYEIRMTRFKLETGETHDLPF